MLEKIQQDTRLVLLSDIDGVVCDWYECFARYMTLHDMAPVPGNPERFDMKDKFVQIDQPWKHIESFQSSDIYSSMKVFPDVIDTLKELKKHNVEVHFVTSCGDTPKVMELRTKWLKQHLDGLYTDIHFLSLNEDKSRVLELYKGLSQPIVFIDDQTKMLEPAKNMGYHVVLKDMEYNQDTDGYQRAFAYGDLIDICEQQIQLSLTQHFAPIGL